MSVPAGRLTRVDASRELSGNAEAIAAIEKSVPYRFSWWLCCGLSLVLIWAFEFLPMVDLPQHVAQLTIWLRWHDPSFGYQEHLESTWTLPYLFANTLAYLLGLVLPPLVASKVLISAAILGFSVACRQLLRLTGGNPWWTFLVFPSAFAFSFFWGFFNFLVATPLVFLFLVTAWRYAATPTRTLAWQIFVFIQVMFIGHALLFGLCGLIAALLVSLRAPNLRSALGRLLPLAAALPGVITWIVVLRRDEVQAKRDIIWTDGVVRPLELVSQIVGMPLAKLPFLVGALLLCLPFALGARLSRQAFRWAPFWIVVGLYFLVPINALGTAELFGRFAAFVLPTWLMALEWQPGKERSPRLGRAIPVAVAVAWLLYLCSLFAGFEREMVGAKKIIAEMAPNRRVLYLPGEPRLSAFVPYPVFLHSGHWYQVASGGMVDFSFAEFFQFRFRYRPEHQPPLPGHFHWDPWPWTFAEHGGTAFDYFLVHSVRDRGPEMFAHTQAPPIVLEAHEGDWWLYRRGAEAPTNSWLK